MAFSLVKCFNTSVTASWDFCFYFSWTKCQVVLLDPSEKDLRPPYLETTERFKLVESCSSVLFLQFSHKALLVKNPTWLVCVFDFWIFMSELSYPVSLHFFHHTSRKHLWFVHTPQLHKWTHPAWNHTYKNYKKCR